MAKSFTITTTATDTLKADDKGHAQAVFTVTNATARPVRGMARAKALGNSERQWLSISGETERDFGGGATEQFTINFDAAGAPAGKYPFRLDVASALNPDEDLTEGPTVNVEVAGAAPPPPPPKKFPMWIIFVILGVLLLVGVVVLIVVLSGGKEETDNGDASPTPVDASPPPTPAEASPTSPATPPDGNQFRVIGTTLVANPERHLGPCPVMITFSGSITANKAGTVRYTFVRSDGAIDTRPHALEFDRPGSKVVETTWQLGNNTATFQPFRGSQRIRILSPNQMESDNAVFVLNCRRGIE